MLRTPAAQASPTPQLSTPRRGLPRLSHRRDLSTPLTSRLQADATPDLSMFSSIGARATPDNRTAQRFFSQVKRRAPSVTLEEGTRLKFAETPAKVKERTWDLTERLEAYELKSIQTTTLRDFNFVDLWPAWGRAEKIGYFCQFTRFCPHLETFVQARVGTPTVAGCGISLK